DALEFVRGKREVLVVEEKRGIIEGQLKEYFYDWPGHKPQKMVGKHRAAGDPLLPWTGELTPLALVPVLAERLNRFFPEANLPARAAALTEDPAPVLSLPGATRTPYFCSGCPHNTSTRVPEGSQARSGIGCHVMAGWMGRNTGGFAQMGGEGVPWVAAARHLGNRHIFQNLGEGTWYHSGSLAIRQAVAAGTNITYKILYNDAVAMTGGQPVDGPVSVSGIAQTCRAEGIERIALVSDDIAKFDRADFPPRTSFHPRSEMDAVQRELRTVEGVSILIYEQTCATEKRRHRKRGTLQDPPRFAWINDLVCEGCGDCSAASNCLSVEPLDTPLGRKRRINLSSCNKDFSCQDGFCPSFVTVEDARRRKRDGAGLDLPALAAALPHPALPALDAPYDLLVAGVGGTGIVTLGALVTMAAHLEGKGASVLDFTGFAQKFGTVLGYVRLAAHPEAIHQVRIERRAARAVVGADAVVLSSPKASVHLAPGTAVVLNRAEMPTGDIVLRRDADLRIAEREAMIRRTVGDAHVRAFDANRLSEQVMGDAVYANIILLGAAWQQGLIPVGAAAMDEAIALNGVSVERNRAAFALGRLVAADDPSVAGFLATETPKAETLEQTIARRVDYLTGYHNARYARRYAKRLEAFRAALPPAEAEAMTALAARALFKLMAIKDEYEVARLMTAPAFAAELAERFEGDFSVTYHMAPPLLPLGRDGRGRPKKRAFGPWMTPVLRGLAGMKRLRFTPLDPFALSHDRRMDRALLRWFEAVLDRIAADHAAIGADTARAVLAAPMEIRGYGPVREAAAQAVLAQVQALWPQAPMPRWKPAIASSAAPAAVS
ncbi:MAG: indolepyruvate ferredoxin oxidoreductase family protein, partial [Roseivivax sp.]|nr:indolepyruvate ferredoxin oxidoreductase family protein [Roseivivax sp.]